MIHDLDACGLAAAIRARELSPVEVIEASLAAIEARDGGLGAFTVTFAEEAREQARRAEKQAGEPGAPPLLGVPVSMKDHVWMQGKPATNGSRALRDFLAPEDCGLVEHLRASGAIVVGKTNNPEFLYRGFTDNDLFGPTRNPWDRERTAGGSSGGAAVSVAAGMTPLAVGTDGGGSIRIPACFCGVVGLKPTHGLVPTVPGFRGWPTLSVAGPIARTVRDAALLLSAIAGLHPADDRSLPTPIVEPSDDADLTGLRVAVTEDMGFAPVDAEVRQAFRRAVERFADTGAHLIQTVPDTGETAELWWRIAGPESYASEGPLLAEHEHEMTAGTAEIIRSGERATAQDYLDAQHDRARFTRGWAELFTGVDLLIAPCMQVPAFPLGQGAPAEVEGRPCDPLFEDWCSMILVANLTQQPCLSVPIGFTADGLPLGMQILARRFEDHLALRAGAAWERLHPFEHDWPPL